MSSESIVHVFMCTNKKEQGACCANSKAQEMYEYCKKVVLQKRNELDTTKKFKVVKTSCLGKCAIGPNMLISPDNVWYKYSTYADIDEIIDSHLIANKVVSRLL